MKKIYLTRTLVATSLLVATCYHQALAGNMPTPMDSMNQRIQDLIDQNRQLTQRVGELEGKVAETNAKTAEQLKTLNKQDEKTDSKKISDSVTLSGLVEVEFAAGDDFVGENFNKFDLATVELGLDAKATDWAAGHILLKYEDGDDEDHFFIDEATIILGDTEKFPLLLTAGKFYMPFGNFETHMIQDPLTLEIGEINDSGVSLGFEASGFIAAVYGYKGMNETGASDTIKGYGAMTGYKYEQDETSFNAGVSWINNIADSDGAIADAFDGAGLDAIDDFVNGLGAYIGAGFGSVSFFGEYVTSLDSFSVSEIAYTGYGAKPSAWNSELAYTIELLDRATVFAVGYQQTDEAVALGLPKSRCSGAARMEILPTITLSLEYAYDDDYDLEDGGSGENANVFTTQLAYEF
jgi:hypothetical protein